MTSQIKTHHHNNSHVPVLLDAVLEYLRPVKDETYLDLTAGYAGHAQAVLQHVGDASKITLVDRDESAIRSLQPMAQLGARVIHSDFASAAAQLHAGKEQFDMILLDLGVSSPHLDNNERGFSFMHDAKLDMRMDQSQSLTAEELLNTVDESSLAQLLTQYGEEPKARAIARAIVQNRPLGTTTQLADTVSKVYKRRGKTHPATRTFQAVRIAVNDELHQLSDTLPLLPDLLHEGGRVVIISFHSLEDRLVKQYFTAEAQAGYEAQLKVLTKRPVSGQTERSFNPRARSAMLRAAVKIKKKGC